MSCRSKRYKIVKRSLKKISIFYHVKDLPYDLNDLRGQHWEKNKGTRVRSFLDVRTKS